MTTIKSATTQDTAPIAKLILLAIQDIAYQLTGATTEPDVLKQLEAFIAADGNRFSSSCILVKQIEDKPAGMILCYHGSDADQLNEPIIEHLKQLSPNGDAAIIIDQEADKDEYYIDALAVDPAHQGKGFAKELISAAEQRAFDRFYTKIALNVDKDNESAHSLYLKLGYEADKEITIGHKPFWHMVKWLNS
ncbi:GNAT family N-acetyltransferase [Cohnella abietis]|uniref:N-acetyltransferase n=1 Tax=Cohnella abietis TaxID=2507935 RepID=A0A3T1D2Y1_9BACL|nr:GNAT family N-acetyltransferase [Cohnella abietis]BBI32444.1 N-acetyltransferase [Cohnella abietis]